jgi:Flp pilus assembly protein TadB
MLFCLNVSLFDAAILTGFEISTKSFLKIFFLVSHQSSRNPQLGIVKAVFDRQLFFRQSSRYRQLIVNRSSIVNRQSSTARQPGERSICFVLCLGCSQALVLACVTHVCVGVWVWLYVFVCGCVWVCAQSSERNERTKFFKNF